MLKCETCRLFQIAAAAVAACSFCRLSSDSPLCLGARPTYTRGFFVALPVLAKRWKQQSLVGSTTESIGTNVNWATSSAMSLISAAIAYPMGLVQSMLGKSGER